MQITDEMVERYIKVALSAARKATGVTAWCVHSAVRAGLEAALNPPAEPEIVVTEEMADAGAKQWRNASGDYAGAVAVYRAMRRLEPPAPGKTRRSGDPQ